MICQREASVVNDIYREIEASAKWRNRVKIIGIGVGNSGYEVNHFRKKYDVPFPLFADGDSQIHQKLGKVKTPYFIGIRIDPDGTHQVFYSELGSVGDAGRFLKKVLDKSGLSF
jgi:peroxiredoxin